ncbi:MAG: hypothetical protein HND52_17495 [Ignavibacteriae bacterium]|nr:hypothetical protein [Ignavibacteriota bacterium]NOG99758.1 hypothetical protein [Ignavibacteriota bacterium]
MKNRNKYLVIIFLITASTIIFEITLSRLFSYMLSYHFAFLVLSISVFGLGVGEIIYAKYSDYFNKQKHWIFISIPLIIILSLSLMLLLPVLISSLGQQMTLFFFIIFTTIPFLAIGVMFSFIFQINSKKSYLLYSSDLLGASMGALISVFILDSISILIIFISLASFLFILFIIILFIENKFNYKIVITFLILTSGSAIIFSNLDVPIAISKDKDLLRLMNNPSIQSSVVESRWNLFGKTDLVEFSYPDGSNSFSIFIDGAAGSELISLDELEQTPSKFGHVIAHFPGFFPLQFLEAGEKDTSLIIGPGGGIDIAANYFGKVNFIEAAEVNPSFIELMQKYNPSTFSSKNNIKIIENEGRNYVRKFEDKYDLIFLTIPITKSSRSTDFYMLTENYLFTVEAVEDYLNALTYNGRLVFTMHSYEEIYRFLSTFLEAKNRTGISNGEALKQVYIISNGMKPVIIIKKNKFTIEEIELRHFTAHQNELDRGVFFFPFIEQIKIDTVLYTDLNFQWQMFDKIIYDVADNKYSFAEVSQSSAINLKPTFDDAPFFYNFQIGIPDNMVVLLFILAAILIWLIVLRKKSYGLSGLDEHSEKQRSIFNQYSLISILLGFAYFLIQAYTFQILNLSLDSPTKSISVLLFLFLLGNGFGSLLTWIIHKNYLRFISIIILLIIIISAFEFFFIIPLLRESASLHWLLASTSIPAILLGIPFPLLLKATAKIKSSNGIAFLLGLSSIGGVAASSLSIILALLYGFKSTLILALLTYASIIFLTQKTYKQQLLKES